MYCCLSHFTFWSDCWNEWYFIFIQELTVGCKKPFTYTHYIETRANNSVHLVSGLLVNDSESMSYALGGTWNILSLMWLVDISRDRSTLSRLTQLHCLYSLCHLNSLMERKLWARTLVTMEKLRAAGTGGWGCRREEMVLGSDSADSLRLTFLKTSWSHNFNLHLSKGMRQISFLSV